MKILLVFSILLFAHMHAPAQSIIKPLICHDKDYFLKCFNDGTDLVLFEKGNLIQYKRIDGSVFYSDAGQRLLIVEQTNDSLLKYDTTSFELLKNSLLIKIKDTSILIKSKTDLEFLPDDFEPVYDFYYGRSIDGLKFNYKKGSVSIRIQYDDNPWGWDIVFWNGPRTTFIAHNSYKKNRLQLFSIQDSLLVYGMSISTTFNNLKRVSTLRSSFVTTWKNKNGQKVTGELKLENPYVYTYNKNGKLKNRKNIQICSCAN